MTCFFFKVNLSIKYKYLKYLRIFCPIWHKIPPTYICSLLSQQPKPNIHLAIWNTDDDNNHHEFMITRTVKPERNRVAMKVLCSPLVYRGRRPFSTIPEKWVKTRWTKITNHCFIYIRTLSSSSVLGENRKTLLLVQMPD